MNKELIMALDALEKENGIDKEIMFAAIEKSLMDEYKAEFDKADNGRVELDRRTGRPASTALFSCRFKRPCPPRRQRRLKRRRKQAYNTLHFATQSRVPKGCPLETPPSVSRLRLFPLGAKEGLSAHRR